MTDAPGQPDKRENVNNIQRTVIQADIPDGSGVDVDRLERGLRGMGVNVSIQKRIEGGDNE
jgi:hypothetical protein